MDVSQLDKVCGGLKDDSFDLDACTALLLAEERQHQLALKRFAAGL
jgi:hypothetical protein